MLQLIEHYDVKIFLILALFDWIAATFLSDPHPSNTTGSFQVSRTKCQSNRLRYSVAGATKDAFGRLKCIHLVPWWVHHSGPVRQCSEVSRGWRLSFGKKSSDWEKRVFDIGIQWNKQYKQDNDGQWYKIRFASEWIVNWLIDVDRDLVMRWHLGKWQKSMALFSSSPRSLCRGKLCLEPTLEHAAEFKPGQKSHSPRQAAKYEYGDIRTYNIYRKVLDVDERWVYDIMEHVCRDIGQQTCRDGITRIRSFSEQLACIKQHAACFS